jgi:hypothetical protein
MIIFQMNKKRYKLIDDWQFLPLNKAIEASKVELQDTKDMFDWFQQLPAVKKLFLIFTNVEEENIEYINPNHMVYYFVKYILPMVQDIRSEFPTTYQPIGIEEFAHRGIKYLMPSTFALGDEVILQSDTNVKAFREASNLLMTFSKMRTEGIKIMPYFCASLVKQVKDEEYDEQKVLERAEAFQDLPMNIVWEVFFYTTQHITRLQLSIQRYIEERIKKVEAMQASRLGRWLLRKAELPAHYKTLIE